MTEEMLEQTEPHWTEPFKVRGQINLFIKGAVDLLDTEVPKDAHALGQVFDDDGEYLRQKTVLEFVGGESHVSYSPDGKECMFLACAMEVPCRRQHRFSLADAEQWKFFANAVWGDTYKLLTVAERNTSIEEWDTAQTGADNN